MGRSVDYLNNALKVAYFPWPTLEVYDEETDTYKETDEFEDSYFVVENIQQYIMSEYPEFECSSKWDGRETRILLEGYKVQIGLSEYCGLASLSIRIDEDELDYETFEDDMDAVSEWIDTHWENISKPWSTLNKIGTFSNGESIYIHKK